MAGLLTVTGLCADIRRADATVHAVDGVSLSVAAGECLGLVGESGCGKTMTVRSIMRLLPRGGEITAGSVVLDGVELTGLSERDMQRIRGNDIGMVFQDPSASLNPTMAIGGQIAESLIVHQGATRQVAAERAAEVLALVRMPEPERLAGLYPHQLSGGMQQRAAIAAAIAARPRLLIADEPTTALDVTVQREILDLLAELRAKLGMAVILVTHDLGVIGGRTDAVAVMYGGRVIERAATRAVFGTPRHPYTEALFAALPELARPGEALYSIPGRPPELIERRPGCSFAERCRYRTDWCTTHEPVLDGEHPGHAYACFFPVGQVTAGGPARLPVSAWLDGAGRTAARAAGQPLLRVTGLVKRFPAAVRTTPHRAAAVTAVAGVSFALAAGQTMGLVGESGCGKTTLARLLAGLERADAGSVEFGGTDLTALRPRQRRRHTAIQLMSQDAFASLDPMMRVGSILREPLLIAGTGRSRGYRRQVNKILDEVGLPAAAADRLPREFSGGQRQRLALARALIQQPALIVADEPVSSLDVSVQAQILNLMRKLQRQYGLSYLFISHDLSVVRYMADVICVMYLGKLVETGPAEAVCAAPGHPYTRGLIEAVPVLSQDPAAARLGPGLPGEPPAATDPPSGCRFRTRCPRAQEICAATEPEPRPHGAAGQQVACHFPLPVPAPATESP